MKKILFILIAMAAFSYSHGQSLEPTVVSSQGGFYSSPTVTLAWTLGEVISETYSAPNYFLTEGFHQPNKPLTIPDENFAFYNGFSPNGDGINDWWDIPVLSYHLINSVEIINRWGDDVWKRDNYDNKNVVFRGQNMNGNDLPDGTYYYIINYGSIEKRGWVFIKR
jgi:gliding motility-associated-like protein